MIKKVMVLYVTLGNEHPDRAHAPGRRDMPAVLVGFICINDDYPIENQGSLLENEDSSI